MNRKYIIITAILLMWATGAVSQSITPRKGERIFVRGGIAETAVENKAGVDLGKMTPDSLYRFMAAIDSLRGDGVRFDRSRTEEAINSMIDRTSPTGDTLDEQQTAELVAERLKRPINPATVRHFMDDRAFLNRYIDGGADTLLAKLVPPDTLSKREKRRLARLDTTRTRYNNIFRDSLKLSPVILISTFTPGFSQFYNEQYWKIPILYGTVAAGLGLYFWQSKIYRPYKAAYDYNVSRLVDEKDPGYERYKNTMTDLQVNMIRHNNYRNIALGFSIASYLYFLVDGTLNYKGVADDVKRATTLSTVFPGAGQIYNKNYWKIPLFLGGAATFIYCIDWNNRGYQRFLRAYNAVTDSSDETVPESVLSGMGASELRAQKDSYRRNRDLCIILAGLWYFIQIIDAHTTAHLKTYDISDDLSQGPRVTFEPSMGGFYSQRYGADIRTFGFSLGVTF